MDNSSLELVKISNFPESTDVKEWVVVSDAMGNAYKVTRDNFKAFLGTVQSITPRPIAPTDPTPTLDGVYIPTVTQNESGTPIVYTNAGGLTVNTAEGGEDYGKAPQLIRDGSVWVKSSYPLPIQDISGLAKKSEVDGVVSGVFKEQSLGYPIEGGGIWSGNIGEVATVVSNPQWTRGGRVSISAGSTLDLSNYNATADSNFLVFVMGSSNLIVDKFPAGAGFATGNFTYQMPEGTSYVLFNYNHTNPLLPISGVQIKVKVPQIRKSALQDVYSAIESAGGNDLIGINFTALGDSITALSQGDTYANRIADWITSQQYTNYAIGGATWAYRAGTTPTDNPVAENDTNVMPNQVRKLVKAFSDGLIDQPDLIILSALINDVQRALALGDVITEFSKPLNSVDMQTLVGAVRWSVSTLMQTFPDVRILILTPLLTSIPTRGYAASLPYVTKLKEVASRLSVPVIDCFGESLINEVNEARYMQADKLHPNSEGQQMQALFVYRRMKNAYYNVQ